MTLKTMDIKGSYLEEEKLHDIFQDMMVSIIKERPADPI